MEEKNQHCTNTKDKNMKAEQFVLDLVIKTFVIGTLLGFMFFLSIEGIKTATNFVICITPIATVVTALLYFISKDGTYMKETDSIIWNKKEN